MHVPYMVGNDRGLFCVGHVQVGQWRGARKFVLAYQAEETTIETG